MRRIATRVAVVLSAVTLVAVLASPALAMAATAHPAGGSVDVQLWPQDAQTTVIVALDVPGSVKLPTVVRLPFPPGAQVQWAGEILGGDPAADPARPYKVFTNADGGKYAQFTLTKSRRAQIDTAGLLLNVKGTQFSGTVDWIQSVDASLTTLSVRVPPNAANVSISPPPAGAPDRNATGEALYTLAPMTLAQGKKQRITFSYVIKAPGAVAQGGSRATGLIVGLGVALGVAIVMLLVLLMRNRQATNSNGRAASDANTVGQLRSRVQRESESDEDPADDESFLIE